MSSIYRKGRDGYFYYQTYVFNKETGKKDKKIFHSLGTKDFDTASVKKLELDKKYNHKNKKSNFSKNKLLFGLKVIFPIIILFFSVKFLFRDEPYQSPNVETHKVDSLSEFIQVKADQYEENIVTEENLLKDNLIDSGSTSHSKVDYSLEIPVYVIARVERIPGNFNQGKLFVTIDSNPSTTILYNLCKNISEEYSEFSNILICIYSNSKIGNQLAMGKKNNFNIQEIKMAWLAMYTYNSVEGEYFDDNPANYIGTM